MAHPRIPASAAPVRRELLLTVAAGTLGGVLTVAWAWLLADAIAAGFLRRQPFDELRGQLLLLAAVAIGRAAVGWIGEALATLAANRAKAVLRGQLLDRLFVLGPRGLSGERTGEIANTFTGGVEALDGYVGQYLPQFALAIVVPSLIGAAVLAIDPLSALVLLLTFPLIPLFMFLLGGAARERAREQWLQLSRLSTRFFDAVQGLPTLKLFGRSREEGTVIAGASARFRTITLRVLRLAFLSALVLELLATLSTAIVAVEVGLRLLYDRLELREALAVLILAPEFFRPLRAFGAAFHAGMAGREAEARAQALLGDAAPVQGPAIVPRRPGRLDLREPPSIRFDRVTFGYAQDRAPALDTVSFVVESTGTVALAGPSGAGKTTAAHLLLRFIEPESGRILVNGEPLASIDPREWRSHVGWVPQRPHIFHGSVRDNLRIARPEASEREMEAALAAAHVDRVIAKLPDGLDTCLGERGARLSGGEAQRLALARAFLRDAPVLVLDEPTSQLDPEHEGLVVESMRRLIEGRTVLLIAHRLTTLFGATRVVMLERGRVREAGTHAQLGTAGGLYAELFARMKGLP
jgi:ATP-binding cassette subfamily C protein CydD